MTPEIGDKYGRLTFLRVAPRKAHPKGWTTLQWAMVCDCDTIKILDAHSVKKEKRATRSCGCLQREIVAANCRLGGRNWHTTHGMTDSPFFNRWKGMRQRCQPRYWTLHPGYTGVECCDLWVKFVGFAANQPRGRAYEPGLVLARFGDKGNYEPDNCRWATKAENSRESKERSMHKMADGRFAFDVAKANGISGSALRHRLIAGDDLEEAATRPIRRATKRESV
jgi:hypothetical protein